MNDNDARINGTRREIGSRRLANGEGRSVVLRRSYGAPIEDVWEACTDPGRLRRWFLPVSGDLRHGGTYRLDGHTGEILRCERPRLLAVSWVYGDGPYSEVELRLSPGAGGGTVFELEHAGVVEGMTVADLALAGGPGWDIALVGLEKHLRGEVAGDPAAWENSPEARAFAGRSIRAWTEAVEAEGASTDDEIAAGVEAARAQYVPDAGPDQDSGKAG